MINIQQTLSSNPILSTYSLIKVTFKLIGVIPGISDPTQLLYNELILSQQKLEVNKVMQPLLPRVTPFTAPLSHIQEHPFNNGISQESIELSSDNIVTYEYAAFDIANNIILPEISNVENFIIMLFDAFIKFVNRYHQYLSFEVSIEHKSNTQVLYAQQYDNLGSITLPTLSYEMTNGQICYDHLISGDNIHRIMMKFIESFRSNLSKVDVLAYNKPQSQNYINNCLK